MLTIVVKGDELYDEERNIFIHPVNQVLQLEHSLVSISKWESFWKKPFLTRLPKTEEETNHYVKCMTITQNVNPDVYSHITSENLREIEKYIGEPMTATTFSREEGRGGSSEIITSELIYYWMIALNIPFECQKWHLNRLLALVNVCNIKNKPPKKMPRKDVYARNRNLNAARRKATGSKG